MARSDRKSGENEYSKIKLVSINNFSSDKLSKEEQCLCHGGIYGDRFIDLGDDFEIHFIFLSYLKKVCYTYSKSNLKKIKQ